MFGNLSIMELSIYYVHLGNLEMQLANLIEHLNDLVMELGDVDNMVVELGSFVG